MSKDAHSSSPLGHTSPIKSTGVSRRQVLLQGGAGLVGVVAANTLAPSNTAAGDISKKTQPVNGKSIKGTIANPNVHPLAQDFTEVCHIPGPFSPDKTIHFMHDPNMALMPDGGILVASPMFGPPEHVSIISRSDDGGKTWLELCRLPFMDAVPMILNGKLYMWAQRKHWQDFLMLQSTDRGATWSDPVTIFTGSMWNISSSTAIKNNKYYWAFGDEGGLSMIIADLGKDPLDPAAWSKSNIVPTPELPHQLTRNLYPPEKKTFQVQWGAPFLWLEPNTVLVNGRIRVFVRCVIDEYATANLCAVLDYDDETNQMNFTQFYPMPGGQNKFFILHDEPARTYWLLSNLPTNSQDLLGWGERITNSTFMGGPGNERRWLFLHYSIDCLNWFPAGCVARWPEKLVRSFMYPSAAIDGEDIILTSRTSKNSRNQHDGDRVTFHRIRDFRSLAMDLHAGPEAFERSQPDPAEA